MTTRRPSLQKQFPGKPVARIKLWLATYHCEMSGPIPLELSRLIVQVWSNPDPRVLKKLAAISAEIERAQEAAADRRTRQTLTRKRDANKIGRRS